MSTVVPDSTNAASIVAINVIQYAERLDDWQNDGNRKVCDNQKSDRSRSAEFFEKKRGEVDLVRMQDENGIIHKPDFSS